MTYGGYTLYPTPSEEDRRRAGAGAARGARPAAPAGPEDLRTMHACTMQRARAGARAGARDRWALVRVPSTAVYFCTRSIYSSSIHLDHKSVNSTQKCAETID